MLPEALGLIVSLSARKKPRGNSHFNWRMHSPRVYFNNIGSICTDSLRHGNGLSALLLLTRAEKSSAAKSSAAKTRSMESSVFWSGFGADFVCAEHAPSKRCFLKKKNAPTMNIGHVSMGADFRAD